MSLEEIRTLVRTDLAGVDAMIRARLKSAVPLVDQVAEHIIGGGGKRLRPCSACSPAAPAVSTTKSTSKPPYSSSSYITATLLHDDVVDGSMKRRGRATANITRQPGERAGGDFPYSRAAFR
jgi:octaprenyl-diphosphate synthase